MKISTIKIANKSHIVKAIALLPVFILMMKSGSAQSNAPVAGFSASNSCRGESVSFSNSSSFDSQASFEWNFGDGVTDTSANPAHLFTQAGEFNVSLIVSNDNGIDSITKKVVIYSTPVPEFSFVKGCAGDAIAFTDSSLVANSNVSYFWSFGDGTTSTLKNPTHSYKTASNFLATLKVTTDNGCSDFVSKVITRHPQPTANFVWSEACEGEKLSFFSASEISLGSVTSLKWEFGNGVTSTSPSTQHLFGNAGEYTVKLIAISDKGCKDSAYRQVQVNSIPVADFTFDKVCEGSPVSFSNLCSTTSGTIISYTWEFGDGATKTGFLADHKFSKNTNLTATLKATTDKGCIGLVTKTISFHEKPIVDFKFSKACMGDSVEFTAIPAVSQSQVATCSWTFGDGTSALSLNPKHQYNSKKSYSVTLYVTSSEGCTDSVIKQVQIAAPPVSYFTSSGAGYREVALAPVENYAARYDWSFGDGSISTDKNPVHAYSNDNSYNVMLKVTSDEGCTSSHSTVINISTVSVQENIASSSDKSITVYPNPYAGNAHINYSIADVKDVTLTVTDIMGKELAVLASEKQMAGDYSYDFSSGRTGIYYVVLKVGDSVTTTKIVEIQ